MSASNLVADAVPPTQTERRWLIALLLLAAILRVGIICWKPESLTEDRDMYWGIARRLAAGNGFAHPDLGHPTAYRPPLYPLLLAGMIWLGGNHVWLAGLQAVLSVMTVALTWILARRLSLGRMVPLAVAFVVMNPLLIQMTALAMTETLCALLVTLALLSVQRERQKLTSQRWLIGVLIGLAALCRPTVWAFVVLASIGSWLVWWRRSGGVSPPFSVALRPWLPVVVAFGITIAPWVFRNFIVFGQPIVTTTHGGYTLLLGNNDEAYRAEIAQPAPEPWDSRAWQESIRLERHRAGIESFDEVEIDRWMSQRAKTWIRQHPHQFAELCWLRIKRFWNIFPGGADAGSLPKIVQWGMAVFFAIELLAAAAGLWRLRRDEWTAWWPLVLLVLSFALVHVVYWSNLRMRAPIEPVLALLAARGLVRTRREGNHVTEAAIT